MNAKKFIKSGNTALIKPNWVFHKNLMGRKLIKINLLTWGLIGLSWLTDYYFGFNFLLQLTGSVLVILVPGYFLSLIFFRHSSLNFLERFMLSAAFSLLIPPALVFYIHHSAPGSFSLNFKNLMIFIVSFSLISSVVALLREKIGSKSSAQIINPKLNPSEILFLGLIVIFYLILNSIFISRQPYIISPDSSYFYRVSQEAIETTKYPEGRPALFPFSPERYQPLMQTFTIIWGIVSQVSLVFIYRYGITSLMALMVIPIYLLAKQLSRDKKLALLTSLLVLAVPVLISELDLARPQTLLFFLFPLIIYFIFRFTLDPGRSSWMWFLSALLITFLALKTHIISMFFAPLLGLGLIIKYWNYIKIHPFKSLYIVTALAVGIYPYLEKYGVINQLVYFFKSIQANRVPFEPLKPVFSMVTYGANYAFLLPVLVLILVCLVIKKKVDFKNPLIQLLFLYVFIFLFFLEILPRLGYPYLPERAFPYLAIGLIILSTLSIKYLFKQKKAWLKLTFAGLFLASIIATIYVNLLPTFWIISNKEVKAIEFLNQQAGNILVVTPINNTLLIHQFCQCKRISFSEENLEKIFTSPDPQETYELISFYANYKAHLDKRIEDERQELIKFFQNQQALRDYQGGLDYVKKLLAELIQLDRIRQVTIQESGQADAQIYIMYSRVKNQSFFNRYDWWKEISYENADLDKFENKKYFEKVFDNGDMVIWKVKAF